MRCKNIATRCGSILSLGMRLPRKARTKLDHCMHGVFRVVFGYVLHVCDCVLHIAWKTYTWYDVYGKCDCVVIARENYMHGIMYIEKKGGC